MTFPIKSKIAGITFKNDDGTDRQSLVEELSVGDELSLQDMSSERYPEAIGVFNEFGDQLGFLPADLARQFRAYDDGFAFERMACIVSSVGRASENKPLGVCIIIAESDDDAIALLDDTDRHSINISISAHTDVKSNTPETYRNTINDDRKSLYSASTGNPSTSTTPRYYRPSDDVGKEKKSGCIWFILAVIAVAVVIGIIKEML